MISHVCGGVVYMLDKLFVLSGSSTWAVGVSCGSVCSCGCGVWVGLGLVVEGEAITHFKVSMMIQCEGGHNH